MMGLNIINNIYKALIINAILDNKLALGAGNMDKYLVQDQKIKQNINKHSNNGTDHLHIL